MELSPGLLLPIGFPTRSDLIFLNTNCMRHESRFCKTKTSFGEMHTFDHSRMECFSREKLCIRILLLDGLSILAKNGEGNVCFCGGSMTKQVG